MNDIVNTIIFPIIRTDSILKALRSLRLCTPPNFKAIVVNQTQPDPEFEAALYKEADLVIRTHKNYGFAQASNFGIRLAPTPYITVCNDDVEFLSTDPSWWDGVLETFNRIPNAAAVNPQSPKEPGWGWGEPGYRYLVPMNYPEPTILEPWADWEMERREYCQIRDRVREERMQKGTESGELNLELQRSKVRLLKFAEVLAPLVYERAILDPEFSRLLVLERNWQLVDAFACWCTVFRAEVLKDIGLLDERFVPGGGEDYDWMSRCYSSGFRALSSSRSWVWHWWGRSKDVGPNVKSALPLARNPWNKLSTKGFGDKGLWEPDVDVWGRSGIRTDPEVFQAPL